MCVISFFKSKVLTTMNVLMMFNNLTFVIRFCDFENLRFENNTKYWHTTCIRLFCLIFNHILTLQNLRVSKCNTYLYILTQALIDLFCNVVGYYIYHSNPPNDAKQFEFKMLQDGFLLPRIAAFVILNLIIANFSTANDYVISQMT